MIEKVAPSILISVNRSSAKRAQQIKSKLPGSFILPFFALPFEPPGQGSPDSKVLLGWLRHRHFDPPQTNASQPFPTKIDCWAAKRVEFGRSFCEISLFISLHCRLCTLPSRTVRIAQEAVERSCVWHKLQDVTFRRTTQNTHRPFERILRS